MTPSLVYGQSYAHRGTKHKLQGVNKKGFLIILWNNLEVTLFDRAQGTCWHILLSYLESGAFLKSVN